MVGGNPKHDAYGFRYWREPVSIFSCFSSFNAVNSAVFLLRVRSVDSAKPADLDDCLANACLSTTITRAYTRGHIGL